ncbi:MAG: bifunctional 4-hydroxy-2-oxoglutarate aldolase/2-dehydro-3-deoxy-phosphogluconate aldolase [Cyclobacteriaceae bacterium]
MNAIFSFDHFNQLPIIGILRKMPASLMQQVVSIYQEAGFSTLEVTLNTPDALQHIKSLRRSFPSLNIGAGTVCTLDEMEQVLAAGATFIVSPIMKEEMIHSCQRRQIPIFPGAFSPSEIYLAWAAGATMVKLFPAGQMGPAYLKDVLAPLDQIKIMPVGGINLKNAADFLKAGAAGLGIASDLFPKDIIERKDWPALRKNFDDFRIIYEKHRQS